MRIDTDEKKIKEEPGIISEIHTDREASYETVSITAYSLSWLMDLEKKSRSWQGTFHFRPDSENLQGAFFFYSVQCAG